MAALAVLDIKLCEQLSSNIEELTTSGKSDLNILKKVKAACRKSDAYVNHVYHLLMHQLEKDHSEIRLATLLVCDELFRRSHHFRQLLVNDFQTFMELTVGCESEEELPPPMAVAVKLKQKALECVSQWYNAYGEGYKKLNLGYHFLKDCKQINFNDINSRGLAQIATETEANRRQEIINNEKLMKLKLEIDEMLPEIKNCVEQMRSCLRLLGPSDVFDEVDFNDPQPCCSKSITDKEIKTKEMEELVKQHGLGSSQYSLTIQLQQDKQPLKVTNDNKQVVLTLNELKHVVDMKFIPTINKWMQVAIKCSTSSNELKVVIDTKNALEEILQRCQEVGFNDYSLSEAQCSSDSEDEFEEVAPKEGFEPTIPVHQRKLYGLPPLPLEIASVNHKVTVKNWKVINEDDHEVNDPTSFKHNANRMEKAARDKGLFASLNNLGMKPSDDVELDPKKKALLERAPKIRVVDMGGVHFDDAATLLKQDMGHRFWTSVQENENGMKTKNQKLGRVVEIGTDSKPIKWSCRVPLPSGKLCPRRDRYKCPLHGKIVARDNMGNPSREEDRKLLKELKEKHDRENPEWQDPVLLKELQAATGIDLTIKKKDKKDKKKKSKKKYPNLTDIKASKSTSRSRLQKKVFNEASVKRVSRFLDSQDRKKFDDKFGNQFNYAWQE